MVAFLSLLTGLGQAAMLIIIVRIATALTADTEFITGSVGPVGASDLTTTQLTVAAFVLLVALFFAELATSWAQASLAASAQRATQKRLLSSYSAAGFETQTTFSRGETWTIVFGHSAQAAGLVSTVGSGLVSIVNFVTLVGSALVLSPVAGVVVLGGLGIMLLAMRPLIGLSRRFGRRQANEQRRFGAISTERLEMTREVKVFGAHKAADQPLRDQIDTLAQLTHRLAVVSRMTSASYRIGAFSLILGMMAVIDATNSTSLASLTGALLILLRSLSYGQAAQASYQRLVEGLPVVEQLVSEERRFAEAAEPSGGTVPSVGIGEIAMRQVSFAYRGTDDRVLNDVSLEIERGDFVALVGPSGAGKSTLMLLLLRLRRPSTGQIEVNGLPVSEIDLAWWRSRVGYVPQEPKLQSGTITETIRFHRADITDSDVQAAARQAHIADEIESWPAGYATDVGQLGDDVSGGQRQRIALARALAGNPDLLLLDEPTSALDPVSEKLISETLEELRGRMTIVVIAHRFRTIERANRVVLLEHGRVVPHESTDLRALGDFMGHA